MNVVHWAGVKNADQISTLRVTMEIDGSEVITPYAARVRIVLPTDGNAVLLAIYSTVQQVSYLYHPQIPRQDGHHLLILFVHFYN